VKAGLQRQARSQRVPCDLDAAVQRLREEEQQGAQQMNGRFHSESLNSIRGFGGWRR